MGIAVVAVIIPSFLLEAIVSEPFGFRLSVSSLENFRDTHRIVSNRPENATETPYIRARHQR